MSVATMEVKSFPWFGGNQLLLFRAWYNIVF